MVPSSIVTGTETTTAFLHSCRTLTRFGSTPNRSATRRSCSLAMSYGFSRRCDSGTSSVVTDAPSRLGRRKTAANSGLEYKELLDRESHLAVGPAGAVRRDRGQREGVVTLWQGVPVRIAAGETERVAAGQQVAHADEQPEVGAG